MGGYLKEDCVRAASSVPSACPNMEASAIA